MDDGAGSSRRPVAHWSWALLAIVMALLLLGPIVYLLTEIFSGGGNAFSRFAHYPGIGQAFLNTVLLAIGAAVIAVPVGVLLAWCTVSVPRRLQGIATVAPIIPLTLPAVANVTAWNCLLAPRTGVINQWLRDWGIGSGTTGPVDVFSMVGIAAVTALTLIPFVFLFVSASLRQRGEELEQAAAACGASGIRAFFTITLPLLRPAIVYSGGLTLLLALGQFAAPLILGAPHHIQTVSTIMYDVSANYPVDYGIGAVMALPLLGIGVAVVITQRLALRNQHKYVSVSAKARGVVTRTTWLAVIPIVGYLVIAVLLPLFALIAVSFSPYWAGKIQPSKFTTVHWSAALNDTATRQAIETTAISVLFTLLLVLPLGFLAATALVGRTKVPRLVRAAIDLLSSISISVPAVVLGMAFLLTYTSRFFNLYGTTTIVVVAYVSLMLPQAIRPQLSVLLATGGEYAEASKVAGANPLITAWRITVPMIRGGVSVAAALVVILVVHEFAVSLMITSPGRRVMGSLLYDATNSGTASTVSVIALLMASVSLVGIIVALWAGGRRAFSQL